MSFDGNGNYTVPPGTDAVTGQIIDSGKYNALLRNLEAALTKAVLRDGQSAALANISMGGFKLTNSANGTVRSDLPTFGQVQDGTSNWLTGVAGSNTITASLPGPSLAAYLAGLPIRFTAAANNTGPVTININAIGAIALTKQGAFALASNDLIAGAVYTIIHDGTRFQLAGGAGSGSGAVGGGVFYENSTILTSNYTLTAGRNAMMAGPLTINSGVALTIPSGQRLVVL